MVGRWAVFGLLPSLWLTATACDSGTALTGFLWDVELTAVEDNCHPEGEGVPYRERFDYRLNFTSSYTELAIGADTFATGQLLDLCNLRYESVVWGQQIDGYEVRWQIRGETKYDYGTTDANCIDEAGLDWLGTETFSIVSTGGHPDLAVGCTYVLEARGVYKGSL